MASRLLPGEVAELPRRRRRPLHPAIGWILSIAGLIVLVWLLGRTP